MTQAFLVVFFGLALGSALSGLLDVFGCPRTASLITSKSSCVYIPAVPIYLNGFRSCLCNRLFIASEDAPNNLDMSKIVNSFIGNSVYKNPWQNQVKNDKKFRHKNIFTIQPNSKNTFLGELEHVYRRFLVCHNDPMSEHRNKMLSSCIGKYKKYCIFLKIFNKTLDGAENIG